MNMPFFPAPDQEIKLMIIDDDPGTIRLLSEILKEFGKIYFTTNSKDALTLAQDIMPDLILLDIEMPDLSGFELCREFKQDPKFKNVPILFVTSHNDMEIEAQALTFGAIDFIHKPPHPLVVKARIGNYLALKKQTDQLMMLCHVDGLTGIANRTAFDNTLDMEWRRSYRSGTPLSLLLFDVDFFKQYNDTYGHLAGDACLCQIAQKIFSMVKRPGELLARYGGEEFVILLPNCSQEQANQFANLICDEVFGLGISHSKSTAAANVTVSIGAATLSSESENKSNPEHEKLLDSFRSAHIPSSDSLIKAADQALYKAKASGRNRVEASVLSFDHG